MEGEYINNKFTGIEISYKYYVDGNPRTFYWKDGVRNWERFTD